MGLTDNGNSTGMYMPVAPAMYGNGNGNDSGFGDGWWVILLLLALNGGWGFGGGFGGMGMGMGMMNGMYEFPWLLNGQQGINNNVSDGFRSAQLSDSITSVRDGIAALSTQLCGCCGDMQMALANGFANVEQGANARQMANMQQAFAAQTAMSQGFNGLQSQLAQCCCDNRLATAQTQNIVQVESAATRAAGTADTQRILDKLCQLELANAKSQIEAKNDTISQLRSELMYARGQASQDVQTAAIQAGQRMLANEVEQYVAPRAIPAYMVQNPNCCTQNIGCSCNGAF